MQLRNIKLINFRNFNNIKIDFSDLTVFLGGNGAGKTNLLEAIYFLSSGHSPKDINIQELIKKGESFSRLLGEIEGQKEIKLELILEKKNQEIIKTPKINSVKKLNKDFFNKFKCVLFSPEDLNLIYSPPYLRRKYFNLVCANLQPNFKINFLKFQKTLQARNKLLSNIAEGKAKIDEIDFWNDKLIKYGSLIILERKKIVDSFNKWLPLVYKTISGQDKELKIDYNSQIKGNDLIEISKNFQKEILLNQNKEIKFGFSLVGPQRDDFIFTFSGEPIFNFASRGEVRTIILSLKFIELKFLEEAGFKPILLLDDVFSELDGARRDFLSGLFKRQQTIVTTTDLEHIQEKVREKAKIFKIQNNKLNEA